MRSVDGRGLIRRSLRWGLTRNRRNRRRGLIFSLAGVDTLLVIRCISEMRQQIKLLRYVFVNPAEPYGGQSLDLSKPRL